MCLKQGPVNPGLSGAVCEEIGTRIRSLFHWDRSWRSDQSGAGIQPCTEAVPPNSRRLRTKQHKTRNQDCNTDGRQDEKRKNPSGEWSPMPEKGPVPGDNP